MKPPGRGSVLDDMATMLPDLASIDCRVAALALAARDSRMAQHLLSRAALLLRIRAVEPTLPRPLAGASNC